MILQSTHSAPFPIEHQHYSGMCTARDAQQYTQQETSGQITCEDLFKYLRCTDHVVLSNEKAMDTQLQLLTHRKRPIATIYTEPNIKTGRQSAHTYAGAHWRTLAHTHTHTHTKHQDRQADRLAGRQTDACCMHISMNLYDAGTWTPQNDQKYKQRHRHMFRHRYMCKHKCRTSTGGT